MADLINIQDLYYEYGDGTLALAGVNLDLPAHSKAALLGPNGAGKSTLFLHFNGLLKPRGGAVLYDGKPVQYNKPGLNRLRQKVGIVFQNPDLQLFSSSVWQDISFGLMNQGCSEQTARKKIQEVGERLRITDLYRKPTHFLSVGQKKMVALAGVLVMEPELIICDEPTAGLDPSNARTFMDTLNHIYNQGTTVMISTHDVDLAYTWADRMWLMNNGQVVAQGTPVQVFTDERLLSEIDLGLPWILDMWQVLCRSGLAVTGLPPTSKDQLLQAIDAVSYPNISNPYLAARENYQPRRNISRLK